MEMKTGYKRNDMGTIPADWNVKNVSDVCTLINGRGFKPHEWKTSGLPIIRIQNLNGSEEFNYYQGSFDPKILVESGQLLFAWSGSRGTSFGPYIWNGGRALLNYHTWKVRVKESNVIQEFFFHALRYLTSYIEDRAHGASALVHTQKWEMEKFPVLIPSSLSEQSTIARALNDVDGLIGALDQCIAKKRDLKQAAIQQLLTGKRRLPEFAMPSDRYRDCEKGMRIPMEWNDSELGMCGEVVMGQSPPSATYNRSGNGSALINGPTEFTDQYPIKVQWTTSPTRFCKVGDLLLCVRGSSTGRTNVADEDYSIGRGIAAIRAKPPNNSTFLSFQVRSGVAQILSEATGSTFPSIDGNSLRKLPVIIPADPLEQEAIAAILTDMDFEIDALEQRLAKTRNLKQGMMQELLTGKTRLI